MKLENWLEKLEMESLEDMAYLDAFCSVMEADEALPEEIFHQLFSGVTEEEIRAALPRWEKNGSVRNTLGTVTTEQIAQMLRKSF